MQLIRQIRVHLNFDLILGIIIAAILIFFLYRQANARDFGQWDRSSELSKWYQTLMMPDNPSIPCCGEADSYFCSETYESGKTICVIEDDRDDAKLKRPHVDNGTKISIPDHKLKYDMGNPTGHAIVFLGYGMTVYCYVRGGGV